MKTAHRREVGCAGNARPYPHNSFLRVKYQVLAANGTSRAELLKEGLCAGMHTLKDHIKPFQTQTRRRLGCRVRTTDSCLDGVVVCNIPSTIFGGKQQTRPETWLREHGDACC
ncbi:hypothetical protein ARMGADRAFT_568477 [Armillaria gallica]|uniref:Uncharacterized protein n=1 Tax=Armillaria gallica TaxID=47427 RepID=A0A2H3DW65_ARMGA|nr:hypothetical protein ARMGADRAFT_568477 [Armillaria gallica]